MITFEAYTKSKDAVEVYLYDGGDPTKYIELLTKYGIQHSLMESKFQFPKMVAYKRTITIVQDDNTFLLVKGKYLVRDNLNTFTVYNEYRFKKLFDKVYPPQLY